MPKDLQTHAENMRKSYIDGGGEWWTGSGTRGLQDDLPADLLDGPVDPEPTVMPFT